MDLSSLNTVAAAEQGATMTLLHPSTGVALTDEEAKKPVTISMTGTDSKAYQRRRHAIHTRKLKAAAKKGRVKITSEEVEAETDGLLVLSITGWEYIKWGGEYRECNPDNIREAFEIFPWMKEQCYDFQEDRESFLGES